MKKIYIFYIFALFTISLSCSYMFINFGYKYNNRNASFIKNAVEFTGIKSHEVIGFLPFWLLDKANKNYTDYLTTLTYFGLTIQSDGTIQKNVAPGEAEPGWYALRSGKADAFLKQADDAGIKKSLLVFSSDRQTIYNLLSNPVEHANTLLSELQPIFKSYNFTNLNIDIEDISEASPEARAAFTTFIRTLHEQIHKLSLGTLSIDVSPSDLILPRLIDIPSISPYIDSLILMTYDYHFTGSIVTGPVAPLFGVKTQSEYDIDTAIKLINNIMPLTKIRLGIPLYGYEWETITQQPRSAVIPGSGLVISNRRVEQFLTSCASCSSQLDTEAQESYVIYKDQDTQTYHQLFFPDITSMHIKISYANSYKIGGVALWALGYDGNKILEPLIQYKQSIQ